MGNLRAPASGEVIDSDPLSPSGRQLVARQGWATAKVIWEPGSEMDGQGHACWDPHMRGDALCVCRKTVALGIQAHRHLSDVS